MQSLSDKRPSAAPPLGSASPSVSRKRLVHLGILTVFPLLLALLNDYWAFTTTQSAMIDPWLYTSYFLHLKSQLLAFPAAYYGDRVSFNVLGWLLYHIFGPWLGNYVLKLSVIYAALFGLYSAVLTVFDDQTALICAALISVQPYFLMAFGWDYVDGIGIAYYSLSLLFVFRATTSNKWRMLLFIAGIFTTLLVTSQLLWLNIAWTVPVLYYVANRINSKHPFWESVRLYVGGGTIAFLACSAIYYSLTGRWFYLANSVYHTLHGFGAAQKVATPIGSWIGYAVWLTPYNALIPVVLWCLFQKSKTSSQRTCLALFAVSYLTIWLWQIVGFPFTQLLYYSDYIFPAYVLGLAALLKNWAEKLRPLSAVLIAGVILAAGGGWFFSMSVVDRLFRSFLIELQQHAALAPIWHYQAFWAAAIGAVVGACLCTTRVRSLLVGVFIAGTLMMCCVQLIFHSRQGWFSAPPGTDYTNKQGFRVVLKADAWANQLKNDRRVLTWYNQGEPRLGIVSGLTSLYLWGWSLLNFNLPALEPKDSQRIQPYGDVLAISWDPDAISKAGHSLNARGWGITEEQDTTIRDGKLALHLAFFELVSTIDASKAVIEKEGLQEVPGFLKLSEILQASAKASLRPGGELHVVTPAQQWAYAAYAALPFLATDRDKVWIRITAKVLKGQAGFGVLNSSEKAFYSRGTLGPSVGYSTEMLEVDHPEDTRKLIIENDTPAGQRSDLLISGISLFAHPNSNIWKRLVTENSN